MMSISYAIGAIYGMFSYRFAYLLLLCELMPQKSSKENKKCTFLELILFKKYYTKEASNPI